MSQVLLFDFGNLEIDCCPLSPALRASPDPFDLQPFFLDIDHAQTEDSDTQIKRIVKLKPICKKKKTKGNREHRKNSLQ